MIIRKTKTQLSLYRYGGVSNGKTLEVRVGSVPLGTSPDAIPAEITDDLSPKELRQLQTELAKDQRQILIGKMTSLVADLNDLGSALESGLLDPAAVVDLHKAATLFGKQSRRVMFRAATENSVVESS
jgi:hypothetical protein